MNRAWRAEGSTNIELHTVELLMLRHQVRDTAMRLAPAAEPEADPNDPFAAWEASMSLTDSIDVDRDPLLERLYPRVHPSDPEQSEEFRRYSEREVRENHVRDAEIVDEDLNDALRSLFGDEIDPRSLELYADKVAAVEVTDANFESWLKVLNYCRLGLAQELNIHTQSDAEAIDLVDPDDDNAALVGMYELMAVMQSVLLELRHDL